MRSAGTGPVRRTESGSSRLREAAGCGPLLVAVAVALAYTGGPLEGQSSRWQTELSGARISYDTVATLNAPSLSGLGELRSPNLFGRIVGSVTGFQDSGWSLQGRGDLSTWFAPAGDRRPFRVELAGSAAGSRHSSGFDSFLGQADARLHLAGDEVGVWGGIGWAGARNSRDVATVKAAVPSVGVWGTVDRLRANLGYLHTTIDGVSYPEANLSVTYMGPVVEATAYAGLRRSSIDSSDFDREWGGASAAVWLESNLAVVISGGRYAPDLLQGLPGGDFISVGLRIATRRVRPRLPDIPLPLVYSRESVRSGAVSFRVDDASRVAIAGDWTGWETVELERDDRGRWLLPAGLEPGVYRFNLLVDGERWIVPEGVAEVDDGFGGTVGLLIISES